MVKANKRNLMMITLDKAIELYLATLETEGKSPLYIDWLKTRLRYFSTYIAEIYGSGFKLDSLRVDNGREYIRHLMERDKVYKTHPFHSERDGKLKIQYIHGLGRAAGMLDEVLETWRSRPLGEFPINKTGNIRNKPPNGLRSVV